MKTLILVDLDNTISPDHLDKVLSFYTKDTKFVFFGIGIKDNNRHPGSPLMINHKKISRLRDVFMFHPKQMEMILNNVILPDAADINMFAYAGRNMCNWIQEGVQQVLVVSGDKGVFNLAVMLNQQFATWIVLAECRKDLCCVETARRLGCNVPRIILKK